MNSLYSVIVRHRHRHRNDGHEEKVDVLKSLETGDTAYHTRLLKKQQGSPGSIKTKQVKQDKDSYVMPSGSGDRGRPWLTVS